MKRVILVVMVLITSICTTAYVRQETLLGEEIAGHNKHAEDLTAAAQLKTFPPADNKKGTEYMRTIVEADLLSLHVCEGNHKLFANEPAPNAVTSDATEEGFVDAEGAAECVVGLQAALREVPTNHPAYADIGTELAWWNRKLMQIDPVDYRRLNP